MRWLGQLLARRREVWRWPWIEDLWLDLRFAGRRLRKDPGFTAAATLALGLGIGAGTAIFSLLDAMLLRPPAGVAAPGELVAFERWQDRLLVGTMGYPDFADYRRQLHGFTAVAAEASLPLGFAAGGTSATLRGALVSGNYFALLGLRPAAGRLLVPADDGAGEGTADKGAGEGAADHGAGEGAVHGGGTGAADHGVAKGARLRSCVAQIFPLRY